MEVRLHAFTVGVASALLVVSCSLYSKIEHPPIAVLDAPDMEVLDAPDTGVLDAADAADAADSEVDMVVEPEDFRFECQIPAEGLYRYKMTGARTSVEEGTRIIDDKIIASEEAWVSIIHRGNACWTFAYATEQHRRLIQSQTFCCESGAMVRMGTSKHYGQSDAQVLRVVTGDVVEVETRKSCDGRSGGDFLRPRMASGEERTTVGCTSLGSRRVSFGEPFQEIEGENRNRSDTTTTFLGEELLHLEDGTFVDTYKVFEDTFVGERLSSLDEEGQRQGLLRVDWWLRKSDGLPVRRLVDLDMQVVFLDLAMQLRRLRVSENANGEGCSDVSDCVDAGMVCVASRCEVPCDSSCPIGLACDENSRVCRSHLGHDPDGDRPMPAGMELVDSTPLPLDELCHVVCERAVSVEDCGMAAEGTAACLAACALFGLDGGESDVQSNSVQCLRNHVARSEVLSPLYTCRRADEMKSLPTVFGEAGPCTPVCTYCVDAVDCGLTATVEECVAECRSLDPGVAGDHLGDTVSCRNSWAPSSSPDSGQSIGSCEELGDAGLYCGDECEAYCRHGAAACLQLPPIVAVSFENVTEGRVCVDFNGSRYCGTFDPLTVGDPQIALRDDILAKIVASPPHSGANLIADPIAGEMEETI